MNRYVIAIALLCSFHSLQADILNGFHQQKLILERDIEILQEAILSLDDDRDIKTFEKQLKKLRKDYTIVNKKYSETEELINTISIVDPELFDKVSNVTNAEGTLTNVIVRFVSRVSEEFTYFTNKFYAAKAYTSVRQAKDSDHVCTSLSGTNTITVTIGYGCDELMALGHEFAHVMYIVPHLKEYMNFWNRGNEFCDGHSKSDPSYFIINPILKNFRENYMLYMEWEKSKNALEKQLALSNNDAKK